MEKRLGIIDLGTNSMRFDIFRIHLPETSEQAPQIHLLHAEKLMPRLGQDVFLTRRLNQTAIDRVIAATLKFKVIANKLELENIIATGTSALREAENGASFIDTFANQTGINLKIISGQEEARLISKGILLFEKSLPNGILSDRCVFVDIGGGSTEFSLCDKKQVLKSISIDLGAARLHQRFLKTNPPKLEDPKPTEQLRAYARKLLRFISEESDWLPVKHIIGTSGTIRSLTVLSSSTLEEGNTLSRETLDNLVKKMSVMNLKQLKAMPGMVAGRADIIFAGTLLLQEIMSAFMLPEVTTCKYSLRHGVLAEEIEAYCASKYSR